jgi:glutaredoxin
MKIELFSSQWCKQCPNLKRILDDMKVDYIVIDVDEQPEYAQRNRIRGLPTLKISSDDVTIFDTGVKARSYYESLLSSI